MTYLYTCIGFQLIFLVECHLADCLVADCHVADCYVAYCHLADWHRVDKSSLCLKLFSCKEKIDTTLGRNE
jgi:hypothetical protein